MTNATSGHGCICPNYPLVVSIECPLHHGEFNAAMGKYGDWERPQRASHSKGSSAETSSPEVLEHVLARTDSSLVEHAPPKLRSSGAQHEHACDRTEHDKDGNELAVPHDETTRSALETLISHHGLGDVLGFIAEVCTGKAEHLREKYQDERSAKRWERSAAAVDKACTIAIHNGT